MRIGETVAFCEKAFANRKVIMLLGPPGVGKTHGKMQAAKNVGMDFIGICSALEDPSSIRGYPSRGTDGRATHCLFDGIARAFDAKGPTVLDFDDLGMASDATKRSILRLFQFGEIDGRKLPDFVVLSASSNDVGQGSDVFGMLEPLKNRFKTIITVETNLEDWISYGLSRNFPSDLLAFVRNSPDCLTDWKPEKSMKVGGCTPRGLEFVAEWIAIGVDDPEVIAGAIGKGVATKYLAYRDLANSLPDIDQILLDPETAPVPDNPSARYFVSMALASKLTAANFGQVLKYAMRLPQLFRGFTLRDAFRAENQKRKDGLLPKDWKPLSSSRDYTAWGISQDGKEIMSAAS